MMFMSRGIISSRMMMLYRLIMMSVLWNTARKCDGIFSLKSVNAGPTLKLNAGDSEIADSVWGNVVPMVTKCPAKQLLCQLN